MVETPAEIRLRIVESAVSTHEAVCAERYRQISEDLKELQATSVSKDQFKHLERMFLIAASTALSLVTIIAAAAISSSPVGTWLAKLL